MPVNLGNRSASEIGAMVNEKVISPVESVEYAIKRIEECNKEVNAFVDLHAEDALRQDIGGKCAEPAGFCQGRRRL